MQEFEFGPLNFQLDKVTTVSAPEELKGTPGVFEQGSVCSGPRWECQIQLRDERWNEYSLADGTYFAKIIFVANKVFRRASAYDRFGQPVYLVEGKPLIKVSDKRSDSLFEPLSSTEIAV